MINESSESGVWSALNAMIGEKDVAKLKKNPKFKDQYLAKFTLHVDDFQTIKIQLRALGLIASSRKARSVKDQGNYWTLTPYGDDIMNRLRAIRSDQEQEVAEGDIREGQE